MNAFTVWARQNILVYLCELFSLKIEYARAILRIILLMAFCIHKNSFPFTQILSKRLKGVMRIGKGYCNDFNVCDRVALLQ